MDPNTEPVEADDVLLELESKRGDMPGIAGSVDVFIAEGLVGREMAEAVETDEELAAFEELKTDGVFGTDVTPGVDRAGVQAAEACGEIFTVESAF